MTMALGGKFQFLVGKEKKQAIGVALGFTVKEPAIRAAFVAEDERLIAFLTGPEDSDGFFFFEFFNYFYF
jgi:hypothetical protein